MCLDRIEKFKVTKNYGYKWFTYDKDKKTYQTPVYLRDTYYQRGKWYTAEKSYIYSDGNEQIPYKTGFHIYYNLEDAKKSYIAGPYQTLCKVEFKNYITGYGDGSGTGSSNKQIVAEQMLIVKQIIKKKVE